MIEVKLTLAQAIEGYTVEKRLELSPASLKTYAVTFQKLQDYLPGDPLLNDITSQQILAMLTHYSEVSPTRPKPLSKKTLRLIHATLGSLWTWAVREGYADEHIVKRVSVPSDEQRAVIPYSKDDVKAMLEACDYTRSSIRHGRPLAASRRPTSLRDRAIILTMLDTGVRVQALCDLCIEHFDANNQRIKCYGKGSKERILRIGRRTLKVLWRYIASRADAHPTDPLFSTKWGDKMNRYDVYRLIKSIGERAGITPHAHPHRFRHTFAINFLRNGGDVYSLKALLGHTTLEMVERYLALAQTDTEAAHRRASPVDNWRL